MGLSFTYSTQSDRVDRRGSGEGGETEEEWKVGLEEEDGAIRRKGENGVTNRRQTDGHYLFKDIKAKVGAR